jgi:hypothetical protein
VQRVGFLLESGQQEFSEVLKLDEVLIATSRITLDGSYLKMLTAPRPIGLGLCCNAGFLNQAAEVIAFRLPPSCLLCAVMVETAGTISIDLLALPSWALQEGK